MDIDVDGVPDSHAEKLQRALDYLGENWVMHKNYKTTPRHSPTDWYNADKPKSK